MRATYRALQRHGYAGLSIQRIADEADLSKSTFYHHYEGKDGLLLSFLEFMLERSRREMTFPPGDDAAQFGDALAELRAFLGLTLRGDHPCEGAEDEPTAAGANEAESAAGSAPDGPPRDHPASTYVELRAQAVHDSDYSERFAELDEVFRANVASLVRRGIDEGTFRDVDPEGAAELLFTLAVGGMFRRVTAGSVGVDALDAEVAAYIEGRLLADGAADEGGREGERDGE